MRFPTLGGLKHPVSCTGASTATAAIPSPTLSASQHEKHVATDTLADESVQDPSTTTDRQLFDKEILDDRRASSSSRSSSPKETKVVEETPLEEAAALDKLSDEPDYPTGGKLAIITLALCLSVFLVALVWICYILQDTEEADIWCRITQ